MDDKFTQPDRLRIMADYDRNKFYQLPKEIVQLYGLLPGFDANCRELYAVLRDKRNESGQAWPRQSTLWLETGMSESTIRRKLKTLRAYGLVMWRDRPDADGYVYDVFEPLNHDEFLRKYPQAIEEYERRRQQVDASRKRDAENKRKWRKEASRSN